MNGGLRERSASLPHHRLMHPNTSRGLSAVFSGWAGSVGLRVGAGVAACLLAGAAASARLSARSVDTQYWWLSEGGPIELATAALHLCVTATLFAVVVFDRRAEGGGTIPGVRLLAVCALCLMLRELDWHQRWTTRDVFKTRTYVDPAISVLEKAAAGLAVAAVVGLFAAAAARCGPVLLRRLRERFTPAVLTTIGVLLLGVSKVLDTGTRLWRNHVTDLTLQDERSVGFVEEIGEAFAPLCLLAALFMALRSRHRGEETSVALPIAPAARPNGLPLREAA